MTQTVRDSENKMKDKTNDKFTVKKCQSSWGNNFFPHVRLRVEQLGQADVEIIQQNLKENKKFSMLKIVKVIK